MDLALSGLLLHSGHLDGITIVLAADDEAPDVKVAPVDGVENQKQEWRAVEEETVHLKLKLQM